MTTLVVPRTKVPETEVGRGLLRGLRAVYQCAFPNGGVVDLLDLVNGNTLTDNNTVTTAAGPSSKLARATQFTAATSENLQASDVAAHSFAGDMTIVLRVYLDAKPVGEMHPCTKDNTATNREWAMAWQGSVTDRFAFVNGNANWGVIDIAVANTFGAPATATWYQIKGDVDSVGGTVGIRVNNGARDSVTKTATMVNGTEGLRIGCRGGGTPALFWDGRIAQVCLWGRLLTTREDAYLYNGGQGRQFRKNRGFY